jgi:hypothetical protein
MDHTETGWGYGLDCSGLGEKHVASSCEHSNEPSSFIKCWESPEWLSNCWPVKKDLPALSK